MMMENKKARKCCLCACKLHTTNVDDFKVASSDRISQMKDGNCAFLFWPGHTSTAFLPLYLPLNEISCARLSSSRHFCWVNNVFEEVSNLRIVLFMKQVFKQPRVCHYWDWTKHVPCVFQIVETFSIKLGYSSGLWCSSMQSYSVSSLTHNSIFLAKYVLPWNPLVLK